jgi:RNA polymerase sigma-70 factor (ECF subfamily)
MFQETWASVFKALPTLRDARALPAFLYQTARNRALALLRHRNADLRLYATVETLSNDTDHTPEFTSEDAAAVHAALNKLSLPHREALTLFFLQQLSIEEIASVLAIPSGTVKSRLHHAKKALGTLLNEGDRDAARK